MKRRLPFSNLSNATSLRRTFRIRASFRHTRSELGDSESMASRSAISDLTVFFATPWLPKNDIIGPSNLPLYPAGTRDIRQVTTVLLFTMRRRVQRYVLKSKLSIHTKAFFDSDSQQFHSHTRYSRYIIRTKSQNFGSRSNAYVFAPARKTITGIGYL